MNRKRLFALGLLFLVAVSTLASYTLFLTDFDPFGTSIEVEVQFPEARSLREGDSVLVAGMRVGRVRSMEFFPDRPKEERIRVVLKLDQDIPLREGYEILIEDATLLGGRNVTIEPGDPEQPLITAAPGVPLRGRIAGNPIESLSSVGDLFEENRESIRSTLDNLAEITRQAREGQGVVGRLIADESLGQSLDETIRNFQTVSDDVRRITEQVRTGQGTIGRLLYDEATAEDLSRAVANISDIAEGLQGGEGTLGRILKDEELSDNVATIVSDARSIVSKINEGHGTIGTLVNDPQIAEDIGKVVKGLADGEGSLGLLLTSDELYEKASVLFENLSAISTHIRAGEGTLGKLVMEQELYDEALGAVSVLTRSLEDFREAAPISTFTSVLFGAF